MAPIWHHSSVSHALHSGIFGERLPLRYYLSGGMLLSGIFTALFGFGYFLNIHVLWYYIIVQVRPDLVPVLVFPPRSAWALITACPIWQALPDHPLGLLCCFLPLGKIPTFGCLLSPCQVCNGLAQTTGWPSVVACVGNWFGKGK